MASAWCLEHKNPVTGNLISLYIGETVCNGRQVVMAYCGLEDAKKFEDEKSASSFLDVINQMMIDAGKKPLENIFPIEHEWME